MNEPIYSMLTGKTITSITVSGAPIRTFFGVQVDFNGTYTPGSNANSWYKPVTGTYAAIFNFGVSGWEIYDAVPDGPSGPRPPTYAFSNPTVSSTPPATGWYGANGIEAGMIVTYS